MNDQQQKLERIIELRQQISALEDELDELKSTLTPYVHEQGDKVACGDFVFRTSISRSWNYSETVAELQTQLRDKKREEVEQGIATIKKETRFLSMWPAKKADEPAPEPPAALDREPPF